jgi:hypothetical protein
MAARTASAERKARQAAAQKRYRERHPAKVKAFKEYYKASRKSRAGELRRKYGITLQEFDAKLIEQKGCCAICKTSDPSGRGDWSVDHDHASGQVRGLLCALCNTGLGAFKDSTVALRDAALYLEKYRGNI